MLDEDLLAGLGHRLPKFWTREFVEDVDLAPQVSPRPTI